MIQTFDEGLLDTFQKVIEESLQGFIEENNITAFQESLRNGMNEICITLQQRLLEHIDKGLVSDPTRRKDWVIARRNDIKTILSPFGSVTYQRTYFRNKKTGKHAHLADQAVGYTPHQRLDTLLEADVLEESLDLSFRKAGKSQKRRAKGTEISGQTVLNIIRKFQPEKIDPKETTSRQRTCPLIYIEADEDHVPHQEKNIRAFEQKLVYIHEGSIPVSKGRHKLLNKKYFTFSPGTKTEEIWNTIWYYLDRTYDLERTKKIYISGDGAFWIKAGADYIPNSIYALDGFHLRQAIYRGAGADYDNRKALTEAIWDGKKTQMNRLLTSLIKKADRKSRKRTIINVQRYLNNNWNGIRARKRHEDFLTGCSAEGHVSHVLSARLSSRPKGWSYHGANQMAHLRVHRENDVDIYKLYLEEKRKKTPSILDGHTLSAPILVSVPARKASGSSFERLDNIPSLRSGTGSFARLLKRIASYEGSI